MRFIIGFLVTIGVIILALILIFHGGGKPAKPTLTSYDPSSTSVELTIDSPVTAAQTHHVIKISVDSNQALMTVEEGYDGNIIRSQGYNTGSNLFSTYLRSLQLAGFTKGNDAENLKDERGFCPLGDRFIYTATNNGNEVSRYWTTSCGQGTLKGDKTTILGLFKAQIPDYSKLAANIQL